MCEVVFTESTKKRTMIAAAGIAFTSIFLVSNLAAALEFIV
jgi:hypothetical protein